MDSGPCLYCSHEGCEPLVDGIQDRLRHVAGRWAFRRCRRCGSALLVPRPRAADIVSLYPPVYGFTPEARSPSRVKRALTFLQHEGFFKPQVTAQARWILRRTNGRRAQGLSVVDIGCGSGLLLRAFRRLGCEVRGVDFQPDVVERIEREAGVPVVCADVHDLARHFPSASCDLVTAIHVLEHVPDVEAVLRQCVWLLKPGGWFVGGVPLIDSPQARIFGRRWVGVTEAPRHLSIPSREGIAFTCREVGFDQVEVRPDTLSGCVAAAVLSAVPGAATTRLERASPWRLVSTWIGALGVGLLAFPWCVVENYVLRRPSIGLVFAHKPVGA